MQPWPWPSGTHGWYSLGTDTHCVEFVRLWTVEVASPQTLPDLVLDRASFEHAASNACLQMLEQEQDTQRRTNRWEGATLDWCIIFALKHACRNLLGLLHACALSVDAGSRGIMHGCRDVACMGGGAACTGGG